MLMAEYYYETDIEVQREEAMEKGYDSGLAEGRRSGLVEGRNLLKQVILLRRSGKTHEEIAAQCGVAVEEVKDMLDGLE